MAITGGTISCNQWFDGLHSVLGRWTVGHAWVPNISVQSRHTHAGAGAAQWPAASLPAAAVQRPEVETGEQGAKPHDCLQ